MKALERKYALVREYMTPQGCNVKQVLRKHEHVELWCDKPLELVKPPEGRTWLEQRIPQ